MMTSDKGKNPSISAVLINKVSIKSRMLLWVICLFVAVSLFWAAGAKVDELVRGEGKVIPSKQLQLVQNLEGGILSELYVSEGDRVEKGEVLLKIDDTLFTSNFNERQQGIYSLQAKVARLRAESNGDQVIQFSNALKASSPSLIREQRSLFQQHLAQLSASQDVVEQQIKQKKLALAQAKFDFKQATEQMVLAKKELNILQPLYEQGVVSQVELLQAEKASLRASGEATSLQFKIPQLVASIGESQNKRKQLKLNFEGDAQQVFNEATAELNQMSQGHGALEDKVERTQVRSPVTGTVNQVMLNTVGGIVKPGMELVSIVPLEDTLLIETKVRPADIARLYPGQQAMVKFTAYDFTVYGGLKAKLVHISADSTVDEQGESFYLVRVKTDRNNLGLDTLSLPIIPGMIAQVDILTGKKTLLGYLLKPILKARQVALTEP
jgi:adhesin transport system membrane fusion protein